MEVPLKFEAQFRAPTPICSLFQLLSFWFATCISSRVFGANNGDRTLARCARCARSARSAE